jgi:hypothetical protein
MAHACRHAGTWGGAAVGLSRNDLPYNVWYYVLGCCRVWELGSWLR